MIVVLAINSAVVLERDESRRYVLNEKKWSNEINGRN